MGSGTLAKPKGKDPVYRQQGSSPNAPTSGSSGQKKNLRPRGIRGGKGKDKAKSKPHAHMTEHLGIAPMEIDIDPTPSLLNRVEQSPSPTAPPLHLRIMPPLAKPTITKSTVSHIGPNGISNRIEVEKPLIDRVEPSVYPQVDFARNTLAGLHFKKTATNMSAFEHAFVHTDKVFGTGQQQRTPFVESQDRPFKPPVTAASAPQDLPDPFSLPQVPTDPFDEEMLPPLRDLPPQKEIPQWGGLFSDSDGEETDQISLGDTDENNDFFDDSKMPAELVKRSWAEDIDDDWGYCDRDMLDLDQFANMDPSYVSFSHCENDYSPRFLAACDKYNLATSSLDFNKYNRFHK